MIDLQKFCATDTDPSPHMRKPSRCADGIVATNGRILICVPDDGRQAEAAKESLAKSFANFKAGLTDPSRFWVDATTIQLPPAVKCGHCHGTGHSYQVKCEDCDGEGEFDHGLHTYECKECGGDGFIKTSPHSDGAKKVECYECDGTGEGFQAVPAGQAHFQRRYLHLIQQLPNCRLGTMGGTGTALFTFDGGWGALMPVRV